MTVPDFQELSALPVCVRSLYTVVLFSRSLHSLSQPNIIQLEATTKHNFDETGYGVGGTVPEIR